ncbi:MAG: DNA-binding protein [Rhizobacter sp.]|nr:DNA-binding protein [Rhizobacter sp.]
MTLNNLLGISLEAIEPDRHQIGMLLAAAERNLQDARIDALSCENRFDLAYKAIMQSAMAALNANGFRTLKSKVGHHQTAVHTLALTIGLPQSTIIVLDALRKQRNLADYSGDLVSQGAAKECLASAVELVAQVKKWISASMA